jgi:ferredoxin-NADP reductase
MKCKIIRSEKHSDAIHKLVIDRNDIVFEPGNCIDLYNPLSGVKKPYSIASDIHSPYLTFYIRIFPSTTGVSQYITTLKLGDEIEVGQPFGYFTPGKNETNGKYIYIATGTGLAPFVSALQCYSHKPHLILYGVRFMADILVYPSRMRSLFKLAVSRQEGLALPKHISGYYSELPVDYPQDYTYYLCGLEEMISDTTQYLVDHGVSWDKIHVEQFYYSKPN